MADVGADPLSFFAGDVSSSSESESEEDKNNGVLPLNDRSYYTSNNQDDELTSKLPSPDSLFSTVGKPEFLTTHLQPHNVDWDKLAKNTDDLEYEAAQLQSTDEGERVSPPPLLDTEAKSEIAAAPVKYSIPPAKVDSKLLTVSSNTASTAGSKRSSGEDEGSSQPDTKKQKGAVFREKEKRKRDLGMSSRGKSFVEEEKRILRQQFDM